MKEFVDYTLRELFDKTIEIISNEEEVLMYKCRRLNNDLLKEKDKWEYYWEKTPYWEVRTLLFQLKLVLNKLSGVKFI